MNTRLLIEVETEYVNEFESAVTREDYDGEPYLYIEDCEKFEKDGMTLYTSPFFDGCNIHLIVEVLEIIGCKFYILSIGEDWPDVKEYGLYRWDVFNVDLERKITFDK